MVKFKMAILLTCHNRKDKTMRCLQSLHSQVGLDIDYKIEVFLVDDGSTDGTSDSVVDLFPLVKILKGDGNLYWNRGMYLAWQSALLKGGYDYYIWLNDDTTLFKDAIIIMLESSISLKDQAILCGCTQSEVSNMITYGGRSSLGLIEPNGNLQKCELINGNFVLIPKNVCELNGILNPLFHHTLGDHEYGLRAKKRGIESYVSTQYIGYCEENNEVNKHFRPGVPILHRLKHLYSPLGANPIIYFKYDFEYFGLITAIKHFFSIHLHSIFPELWKKD